MLMHFPRLDELSLSTHIHQHNYAIGSRLCSLIFEMQTTTNSTGQHDTSHNSLFTLLILYCSTSCAMILAPLATYLAVCLSHPVKTITETHPFNFSEGRVQKLSSCLQWLSHQRLQRDYSSMMEFLGPAIPWQQVQHGTHKAVCSH